MMLSQEDKGDGKGKKAEGDGEGRKGGVVVKEGRQRMVRKG